MLLFGGPERAFAQTRCAFFLHSLDELDTEPERTLLLTAADFARVNPNTGAAPIFRSRRDADITLGIYARHPVLVRHGPQGEDELVPQQNWSSIVNLALGTTTIEYKPFGIGLTVSPTILSENRIALKVAPEASDLDFSRGITLNGATVPAIVTRRADTMVELGDGESFVIGGLVSRSTLSNLDKVPFLGDVPIIGTFFKRVNYNQEERELVIIVTPHLVRPMARNAPKVTVSGNGSIPAAFGGGEANLHMREQMLSVGYSWAL